MRYLKINCTETMQETFKAIIQEQKPLNVYEYFETIEDGDESTAFLILEIPKTNNKGLFGISAEWLNKKEFDNLNVCDYDLRNDLIEVQ